jgi:hypothetical protein
LKSMVQTAQAPATLVVALNALVALIVAFGHLSTTSAATLSSLATAIGTVAVLVVAVTQHKPFSMTLFTGAAAVIFTDLTLFHVTLDPGQIGALVTAVGLVAGLILHTVHATVTAKDAPAPAPYLPPPGA